MQEEISSPAPSRVNMIAKYTVPKSGKKYIFTIPILEKLREVNYTFNEMNELQKDGKSEYRSNGIDLFSYLKRNERAGGQPPPVLISSCKGFLLLLSQTDPKRKEPTSPRTSKEFRSKKFTTAERLEKLPYPEKFTANV
ncbi:hypothetical protein AVEN_14570-1 [Araneus ventricosus]|uniref:Uncharacterized protein n=1 Tax=Araneus ventricosus TaxID=182803 RepID=A0A4Y2CFC9_ARAVE|nr:hypothetical protein AVEN_14570-1 [Araneus ventricosus]